MKSVTIINKAGEKLVMELRHPEKSGFAILQITGLNPVNASITMTNMSGVPGAHFSNAVVGGRNITMQLSYFQCENFMDIDTQRRKIYQFFPVGKKIEIVFEMMDGRMFETTGYIESNGVEIFTQIQSYQISILCEKATFRDGFTEGITHIFYGVEPEFTFPFMNNSLTDNLINFGTHKTEGVDNIYYEGDGTPGVEITIYCTGPVGNIDIYNITYGQKMSIDVGILANISGGPLTNGDIIFVSTIPMEKKGILLRGGRSTNILGAMGRFPDWLQIHKGDNKIAITADNGLENSKMSIRYFNEYNGI